MKKNGMKILGLEAEKIRRLNLVRIQVDPASKDPIFVTGDNDEGKSTTLDCFIWGLAGGRLPDDMIRKGADAGEIRITLGDEEPELTIRKVFKEGQPARLIVKTADGMTGNQGTLSAIVGALGMDPAALANMDGLKQAEIVRGALGIDLDDLDAEAANVFELRKVANAWIRDQEGALKTMVVPEDTPDDEVQVADLLKALEDAKDANASKTERVETLAAFRERIKATTEQIARTTDLICDLDARIEELQERKTQSEATLTEHVRTRDAGIETLREEQIAVEALEEVDLDPIRAKIADVQVLNDAIRKKKAKAELEALVVRGKAKAKALSERLSAIDAAKLERIRKADLPAGLDAIGFDPDKGLTFEGFPLAELGTGKRLRVATQIALAMNPKLRVILIKAGNDLDAKNLAIIAETAAEADAQVWIERVQRPADDAIVVEVSDGNATFGVKSDAESCNPGAQNGDSGEIEDEIAQAGAKVKAKNAAKTKPAADSPVDRIRAQMKAEGRLL